MTLAPPSKEALRVSGWGEGVEECPVGFAGIQQCPDPVVVEVGESEGGAFYAFGQIVGCYLEGWTLWWFGAWVSCGRHVADGAALRFLRWWPRCWARCSRSWWLSALSLVISSRAASSRCERGSRRTQTARPGDGSPSPRCEPPPCHRTRSRCRPEPAAMPRTARHPRPQRCPRPGDGPR